MFTETYMHIHFLELVRVIAVTQTHVHVDHPKLPKSLQIPFSDVVNPEKFHTDNAYYLLKIYTTMFGLKKNNKLYVLTSLISDDPTQLGIN